MDKENADVLVNDPSETVKVAVTIPDCPALGVKVTVQLGAVPPKTISVSSIIVAFEETPLIDVEQFKVLSTSAMVKAIAPVGVSCVVLCPEMAEIVGASFTALMVIKNALVSVKDPSVTVNVIVAEPLALAIGVIAAVQFGAVPEMTILALATLLVSEDVPETDPAQDSDESESVMVNAIPDFTVSSLVL